VLSILDPATQRVLITLFMNSWQDGNYFNYTKSRFLMDAERRNVNMEQKGGRKNRELVKSFLIKAFSVDIDDALLPDKPKSLLINQDERAALTLNYLSGFDFDSEEYRAVKMSPDIDTIYSFRMDNWVNPPEPNVYIGFMPKTPFIDVSHHLQKEDDDKNCVLYSTNFINALCALLKQKEVADRVFVLAQSIKSDPNAIDRLVHIFREDLKTYLPCYYNAATGTPKSNEELEAFHLQQRWEMGALSLSILSSCKPGATKAPSKTDQATTSLTSRSGFFAEDSAAADGNSGELRPLRTSDNP
jgi:hypothetical protein